VRLGYSDNKSVMVTDSERAVLCLSGIITLDASFSPRRSSARMLCLRRLTCGGSIQVIASADGRKTQQALPGQIMIGTLASVSFSIRVRDLELQSSDLSNRLPQQFIYM
jgi:hypothetical protein